MINDNNWYVYQHVRLDKNIVFYIGIGKKENFGRAYEFKFSKRSDFWKRVYLKTEIKVEILYYGLSKDEVSELEKELIKKHGRIDLKEGTLVNLTDGGDGILNCKMSDETKRKLSIMKIGDKNPQWGLKQSDETKEKRSKSMIGQKRTNETKIKQSLSSIKSGQAKEVDVYFYETNEYVGRYYAISEACRQLGFLHLNGKASEVAKGIRNHVKGYLFKYVY